MNVFFRELKYYRKNVLIWSIVAVLLLVSSLAKFTTLESGGVDMKAFLDQFPPVLQAIFGMNGLDITSIVGYFGILFLYLAIMLSIHAGLLGADLIAKEEQDQTTEFLYVKPRSRLRILLAKVFAGLIVLVILNIVTLVFSLALTSQHVGQGEVVSELFLFSGALIIMQILFFFIGLALASSPLVKHAGKLVSLVVFVTYLIYVLTNIQPDLSIIGNLSPFVSFDAKLIISSQNIGLFWPMVYGISSLILAVSAFFLYRKRDLDI